MSNKFCVINCENSKRWSPISFSDMFRRGLQQKENEIWDVYNIASGESLPTSDTMIETYQGIIITGSHFNVRDRLQYIDTDRTKPLLPWFDSLCDLIKDIYERGSPFLYGGCFGCQIIAHALGGEVDYNPNKLFFLKAETLKLRQPDFSNLLAVVADGHSTAEPSPYSSTSSSSHLSNIQELNIIVSHGDCVKTLPPQGVVLAHSDSCQHEMFIVGKGLPTYSGRGGNILCCQSHPEFDLQYCIHERIWPAVVDLNHRITTEQEQDARASFDRYDGKDAAALLSIISNFIHQSPSP